MGNSMPTYILLSTLTPDGRKTIKERPERIKEVNREIESFGVKVLHQYAVLGPMILLTSLKHQTTKRLSAFLWNSDPVEP